MSETGQATIAPADRLITTAELLEAGQVSMRPDIDKALAEWLRCAARVMSARTDGYQRWVDERRVLADGPLGHALNVADLLLAGAALEREGTGAEDPQEELVCAECGYPMDQSDHVPGCGDA